MSKHVRSIVLASIAAAFVVFLVVQDRITAGGAREYVTRERVVEVGNSPPTIDEVMGPAVRRSVRIGALWGAVVLAVGLAAAAAVRQLDRQRSE